MLLMLNIVQYDIQVKKKKKLSEILRRVNDIIPQVIQANILICAVLNHYISVIEFLGLLLVHGSG